MALRLGRALTASHQHAIPCLGSRVSRIYCSQFHASIITLKDASSKQHNTAPTKKKSKIDIDYDDDDEPGAPKIKTKADSEKRDNAKKEREVKKKQTRVKQLEIQKQKAAKDEAKKAAKKK
jgi:hypothetical protein